jgi:hypothetical protein
MELIKLAKRRILIKPLETLELEFSDGTVKEALFNTQAIMLLVEEFGEISEIVKEAKTKPYDFASKILYCGMKVLDTSATYDEVKNIVVGGGLELITTISDYVYESFMTQADEEMKLNFQVELIKMKKKYMK